VTASHGGQRRNGAGLATYAAFITTSAADYSDRGGGICGKGFRNPRAAPAVEQVSAEEAMTMAARANWKGALKIGELSC
jgi:hypothetical protein